MTATFEGARFAQAVEAAQAAFPHRRALHSGWIGAEGVLVDLAPLVEHSEPPRAGSGWPSLALVDADGVTPGNIPRFGRLIKTMTRVG